MFASGGQQNAQENSQLVRLEMVYSRKYLLFAHSYPFSILVLSLANVPLYKICGMRERERCVIEHKQTKEKKNPGMKLLAKQVIGSDYFFLAICRFAVGKQRSVVRSMLIYILFCNPPLEIFTIFPFILDKTRLSVHTLLSLLLPHCLFGEKQTEKVNPFPKHVRSFCFSFSSRVAS